MRRHAGLRLLEVLLGIVLLFGQVPLAKATVVRITIRDLRLKKKPEDNDNKKGRKPTAMPEGSANAILALAAGALSGGLLLARRKQNGPSA
jgi:hypothetical protein